MNDTKITGLTEIVQFLAGAEGIAFEARQNQSYTWIAQTLKRFRYTQLGKANKGLVQAYLQKMTGYSRAQLNRLIGQYKRTHKVKVQVRCARHRFATHYTREDILLLAQTDESHQTLSGPATKKLFERGYKVFGDIRYERLANISVAHLYNLRKSQDYQGKRRYFTKTKRSKVNIGERRKPKPNGLPGYIRIDTVHQGDQDQVKGVYYINAVDEVTQMEVVCSIEKISEQYLIPVLEQLLESFPFKIIEIHSDNGSEYINKMVAQLLDKLLIELTKSRARQSNDNALVESKNGSIVRKCLGYIHIPQKHATRINLFLKAHLVPYINYHRPCYFSLTKTDKKTGKEKKLYRYEDIMTPYDKFKTLPDAASYLRDGITLAELDKVATHETDLACAKRLQKAREKLFHEISESV